MFTATWFAGATPVSSEKARTFVDARDIGRSRLAAHRVRSGATHVEVRADDGLLMFDSRDGQGPAAPRRPTLLPQLIKRWTVPSSSAA